VPHDVCAGSVHCSLLCPRRLAPAHRLPVNHEACVEGCRCARRCWPPHLLVLVLYTARPASGTVVAAPGPPAAYFYASTISQSAPCSVPPVGSSANASACRAVRHWLPPDCVPEPRNLAVINEGKVGEGRRSARALCRCVEVLSQPGVAAPHFSLVLLLSSGGLPSSCSPALLRMLFGVHTLQRNVRYRRTA
jgi:hypothetical protein